MENQSKHPRCAPGDFYTDITCCTGCDFPRAVAPTLFDIQDDGPNDPHRFTCFVSKQPEAEEEMKLMAEVLSGQEFDCIRYRGNDSRLLALLHHDTRELVCDDPQARQSLVPPPPPRPPITKASLDDILAYQMKCFYQSMGKAQIPYVSRIPGPDTRQLTNEESLGYTLEILKELCKQLHDKKCRKV